MRVVTWNVNSLNARGALVERYLDAERPDVLCIQELKLDTDAVPRELFEARGYEVAIFGQPQWNGVMIASLRGLADVERGLPAADEGQSRLIAATVDGVRIVNLYCPQGGAADSPKFPYKLRFYDALIEYVRGLDLAQPTLVVGDLNVAPAAADVWDPAALVDVPSFHPLEHERWGALIEAGLVDVVEPRLPDDPKERFTFWDYRGMAFRFNQGMRIDHILASAAAAERVVAAAPQRTWRKKQGDQTPSDHAPVFVDLDAPHTP
ncbi:MAG: exodeoxyribonuclease III [Myxococcales bacterium]|nr:exodeoxyribonuclease III [Myxococcales bacterium]MCB9521487.1 exodeoxyribonuclease III [Myxococcales bacterium]MCB9531769.1 exodeoxyribonuclease III [Myxococcales bacterium]